MERDRKPVWSKWRLIPHWSLLDAVALSMDIDPKSVREKSLNGGLYPSNFAESREFVLRAEVLYEIVETRRPEQYGLVLQHQPGAPLGADITPADFVRWVASSKCNWTLPPELLAIAEQSQLAEHAPSDRSQSNSAATSGRWPWGDYETALLRCLDAAASRYWVNYDPTDPTTARTNDEVADWLQSEFKLSQNKAQAIATILRADDLPTGPRREK